ncbi:unnamed protein product [Anisakis simplex]|uniref:SH2 domain-containing protein n=1 Tax=Anisakis simplex TaxID=6269 RepID=A0A0M3J765_ANISI|nr:unnamed protein product [Anisakis simplex]
MALNASVLKDVEAEEFYHGFLPREDISAILKRVGDYILRLTQPKPGDPRELVISVRASMEPSSDSVRSTYDFFIVKSVCEENEFFLFTNTTSIL